MKILKSNSLLRICPDCGKVISYRIHFKAFMHGSKETCAYMESEDGKRIWDNKMLEDSLNREKENSIQACSEI